MRFISKTLLVLLFTAGVAQADPVKESRALYETTRKAAHAFVEAQDVMGTDPSVASEILKDRVKAPLTKAEKRWWDGLHGAGGEDGYQPFMVCQTASMYLGEIARDLIAFLGQGADRPDVSKDVNWFREDFSNCELALGLEPTFGTSD